MAASRAVVRGHFGELLQGRVGPQGQVALVTLPCPGLTCTVTRRPGPARLFQPTGRVLTLAEFRAFLRALGLPADGRHVLHLSMPVGAGAGASTAARVAIARAAGVTDPIAIARACLATEGATDPLMFPNPGRVWMPPVWQAISSDRRRGLRSDVCQASERGLP